MKPMKILSLLVVSLFLLLTNYTAMHTEPRFQYIVEEQSMPSGSVPIIADSTRFTFIPNYPYYFIGDSRTVGMRQALSYYNYDLTNQTFTAEIGKGYSWFAAQREFTTISPSIIILNLGVNDLGNLSRYQRIYQEYASTCWSGCPIYIVSVNPCRYPCTSVSNYQIENFNTAMQQWIQEYNKENASASTETFPIRYIDTYHYLMTEGFSSSDGLHYSADTYRKIYAYILDEIQEPLGDGSGIYLYTNEYE